MERELTVNISSDLRLAACMVFIQNSDVSHTLEKSAVGVSKS
jgi:hypothetical protein